MDINSSNLYYSFNEYINNLPKDEKKIIFKLIDKNILPNLFLYNNLLNPINFADFIKEHLYKQYLFKKLYYLPKITITRPVGKSKLYKCLYSYDLKYNIFEELSSSIPSSLSSSISSSLSSISTNNLDDCDDFIIDFDNSKICDDYEDCEDCEDCEEEFIIDFIDDNIDDFDK